MKLTARHALTGTMLVFLLSASAGFLVAHAPSALAQPAGNQAQPSETISVGELDSILAPIALYPDDLLSQMLMAATYPDEVVDANQWLQEGANASLTGDTLISAIDQAPWDPSVKSLVPFPQALKMLADNIEWTTKLGSVFANQQGEVMAEIQKLRDADILLLVAPIWWFSVPAIMKGWFDRVLAMGVAWDGGRIYEQGLMRGKQAMLVVAAGGPAEYYQESGKHEGTPVQLLHPINHGTLAFCGLNVHEPFVALNVLGLQQEGLELALKDLQFRMEHLIDSPQWLIKYD